MMAFTKVFRKFSHELRIIEKIKKGLDDSSKIEVIDLSGGCGTMLQIKVSSQKFKGLSIIQQHRLINKCVEGEDLHGFRVETIPID
jgi:Stress-induced morphogen (activity unknown)